ncbi:hypothetical protein ACRS6K_11690 [Bacillus cytotoxicus]|nr:hypothetical protein [Bacillus cytotoxicus]
MPTLWIKSIAHLQGMQTVLLGCIYLLNLTFVVEMLLRATV